MKQALETLKLATEYLEKNDVARPRRVAEELLAAVIGCPRIGVYLQFDQPLHEKELNKYRSFIARAARHEPYEYIIGSIEFYQCQIAVSEHVLIPRPETEILLDMVCKALPEGPLEVWDVCTGSGCLGLGLKKALPQHRVSLSDLSEEALAVARSNAALNELQIECLKGDLLAPFEGRMADVILCNPPYVTEGEWGECDRSVKEYEPRMALVGGRDGLELYRKMASALPKYLNKQGKVFFEMGHSQGEALCQIFNDPYWAKREVVQDWVGKERFFFLEAH